MWWQHQSSKLMRLGTCMTREKEGWPAPTRKLQFQIEIDRCYLNMKMFLKLELPPLVFYNCSEFNHFFSIHLRLLLFNLICGDLSFPACLIYRFWLWLVFTSSAREVKNRVFPIRGLTTYCCNWPSTEILYYAVASRFDQYFHCTERLWYCFWIYFIE